MYRCPRLIDDERVRTKHVCERLALIGVEEPQKSVPRHRAAVGEGFTAKGVVERLGVGDERLLGSRANPIGGPDRQGIGSWKDCGGWQRSLLRFSFQKVQLI